MRQSWTARVLGHRDRLPHPERRAAIVVFGDVGRSPRMLYHAAALASVAESVDVLAYRGKPPPANVASNPRVRFHLFAEPRAPSPALPAPLFLALSAARRLGLSLRVLWWLLRLHPPPEVILVQNPPALPTLPVALAAARLRGARLVLDWHNLGHSMLALRVAAKHPAVRLTRWTERWCGRRADAHLCVSRAMKIYLESELGLDEAHILRDRPASAFSPLDPNERARTRARLGLSGRDDSGDAFVIVSATSWTADEDFDLLLDALPRLDRGLHDGADVLLLVTGDGAGRAPFEERVSRLPLRRVRVRTGWFEPHDYAELLAAADVGLCLHRSASGLDLPMKILDMFGCGLPVLALDYGPCLREVLREEENGLLFSDAAGLARLLAELIPDRERLTTLRRRIEASPPRTWEQGWLDEARPVFDGLGLGTPSPPSPLRTPR